MYREIGDPFRKSASPSPDKFLDIGGVIMAFMQEKKIDGAQLARLSGVSESEVYNVLKNRRSRSGLKTLQKLARPLDKTLADIFNKLSQENPGNIQKLDKDPAFVTDFKKQGITFFSDTQPLPELFIGKIVVMGGAKGFASGGLKGPCAIFLRVTRGSLEVDYGGKIYPLLTYQKLTFDGRYPHAIRNKSAADPAEALFVTAPSFLSIAAA